MNIKFYCQNNRKNEFRLRLITCYRPNLQKKKKNRHTYVLLFHLGRNRVLKRLHFLYFVVLHWNTDNVDFYYKKKNYKRNS